MSRSVLTTILDAVAVVCVMTGVAFIYAPAAYIVAGLAVASFSWAIDRPARPAKPERRNDQ